MALIGSFSKSKLRLLFVYWAIVREKCGRWDALKSTFFFLRPSACHWCWPGHCGDVEWHRCVKVGT